MGPPLGRGRRPAGLLEGLRGRLPDELPDLRREPGPHVVGPGGRARDGNALDIVAINDTDKDGSVTLEEWAGGTRARFAAIDCDGSRWISTAEAFRFGRVQSCTAPVI